MFIFFLQEEREEKGGKDGEKKRHFFGECANYFQERRGVGGRGGNGNGTVLKVRIRCVPTPRLNQIERKDLRCMCSYTKIKTKKRFTCIIFYVDDDDGHRAS